MIFFWHRLRPPPNPQAGPARKSAVTFTGNCTECCVLLVRPPAARYEITAELYDTRALLRKNNRPRGLSTLSSISRSAPVFFSNTQRVQRDPTVPGRPLWRRAAPAAATTTTVTIINTRYFCSERAIDWGRGGGGRRGRVRCILISGNYPVRTYRRVNLSCDDFPVLYLPLGPSPQTILSCFCVRVGRKKKSYSARRFSPILPPPTPPNTHTRARVPCRPRALCKRTFTRQCRGNCDRRKYRQIQFGRAKHTPIIRPRLRVCLIIGARSFFVLLGISAHVHAITAPTPPCICYYRPACGCDACTFVCAIISSNARRNVPETADLRDPGPSFIRSPPNRRAFKSSRRLSGPPPESDGCPMSQWRLLRGNGKRGRRRKRKRTRGPPTCRPRH